MPNKTEGAAVRYVEGWAKRRKIKTKRVKKGSGFDRLFIYPSGMKEEIEIKGSATDDGLPDMPSSEFRRRRLKADFVHFVANVEAHRKRHYIIPRNEFKPGDLYPKHTYRINIGQRRLDNYLVKRKRRTSSS
ncbi:MAG: hypothetical protein OK438_04400 [Thaumarchaeota archaeon]|nr:hypothetical protein [Nitrososphaerota archaeon]